jgi:hypothetical protein
MQGQVLIRHGDEEVRREPEPFPLYPGEALFGKVSPLQVVTQNTALRLRATRDVTIDGTFFNAGEEWLFRGYAFRSARFSCVFSDPVALPPTFRASKCK